MPHEADDWMFVNPGGRFVNPESISLLFDRIRRGLPDLRIRFHNLRHTHASLLIMDGVPVKVVSERLGHANVAFTMHTYQHLLPDMSPRRSTVRGPPRRPHPIDVYQLTSPRNRKSSAKGALGPVDDR